MPLFWQTNFLEVCEVLAHMKNIITSLHLFPRERFLYFSFAVFHYIMQNVLAEYKLTRLSHMCQPCFPAIYHWERLLLFGNIIFPSPHLNEIKYE